ncbi:hypothetical protein I6E29_04855 [Arcanobacterium haemolyticum]|nr:hypothetical protein [Arcanobacterium haemolyticum]
MSLCPLITDNRRVTSSQDAIREAVREIESYVSTFGWDGPIRVFALIRSAQALIDNPDLASELPSDVPVEAAQNPDALFSVEQENLPPAESIEHLLAQIAWPETVAGAAISCERITLPPEAEADLPDDPAAAEEFLATDPRREDVRIVVGVDREGSSWCALRMRSHDTNDEVLQSADLIPDLVAALKATFE